MVTSSWSFKIAGLEPISLAAKEGLALLNGTQVSTAYALRGLFEAEDLFAAATVCGGLSVEAMLGSRAPFDARIHEVRANVVKLMWLRLIAIYWLIRVKSLVHMKNVAKFKTHILYVANHRWWVHV